MASRLQQYRLRGDTFRRQAPVVRRAIVEATVLLALTRLAVKVLPFGWLERLLGVRLVETPSDVTEGELAHVRTVAKAIRLVSPHTAWTSNCLPQAIAAKLMLRRRGVSSTLYVGAAFKPAVEGGGAPRELVAHAWLRAGPIDVTGGDVAAEYGTVVAFG